MNDKNLIIFDTTLRDGEQSPGASMDVDEKMKIAIALEELKNLDLTNPELQKNIENLSTKQNQLEIEKTQIEEKYKTLLEEHENLSKKLEDLKNKEKLEERKQIEFSEKIDELNQETDTLLDEIDKWQM